MKSSDSTLKLPCITICGAEQLRNLKRSEFTHVVSIWGASMPRSVVARLQVMFPAAKIHTAFFDDVLEDTEDDGAPREEHVREILKFGSQLTAGDSLLVQCLAGVSRSSASAFSIACQFWGLGHELEILRQLVKKHPRILPNPQIVQLADDILERKGVMIAALRSLFPST